MKLTEKIEKLDIAVQRLKHLDSLCPDIQIVKVGELDYYCSSIVTVTAQNVEFLTPKITTHAIHKACVYRDFDVYGTMMRVYGIPFEIKLFMVFNEKDNFHCYDYTTILEKVSINPIALRKMHLYIIEFMREHKIPVNKKTLPDNIRNLLAFM